MALEQLIIGTKLLAALGGQPDTAAIAQTNIQDLDPVKSKTEYVVNTETGAFNDGITNQRFKLNMGNQTIVYDYKPKINDVDPNDAMLIGLGPLYENKDKSFNVSGSLIEVGNWDSKSRAFIDATATYKTGNKTFLLDTGAGFGEQAPLEWILGRYTDDNVYIEGGSLWNGGLFAKNDKGLYGVVGLDLGEVYNAVGYGDGLLTGFSGIKNVDGFGNFIYGTYNQNSGLWSFKSQTAFINPDEGFYSKGTFDFAASYLTIKPFLDTHFSPLLAKGPLVVKVAGSGDHENTKLEFMVGGDVGPVSLAGGLISDKGPNKDALHGAVELYTQLKSLGLNGKFEARYQTDGNLSGYIVTNIPLN